MVYKNSPDKFEMLKWKTKFLWTVEHTDLKINGYGEIFLVETGLSFITTKEEAWCIF